MGLKIVKGKVHPIGIDLGTSAIKMAQLRTVGDKIELIAAGSQEVPPTCRAAGEARIDFCARTIRRLLTSQGFKGKQCLLTLPADETFVHHVKIPKVAPELMREAVLREVQGKLPFPPAQAEVRHILAGDVVGEGKPRQEVIVVAAARSVVDGYLTMARRARLDVVGLNIEPCAIVECFGRLFRRASDLKRTILFIDMGQATTQVVLSHGNQIAFARNLAIAGNRLDDAVAAGLEIPAEQAAQIRRELAGEGEGARISDPFGHGT